MDAAAPHPVKPAVETKTAQAASLTEKLRQASRAEHSVSDSLIAARLVFTATDKRLWARALSCFYYIFAAIEAALDDNSSVPEIAALSHLLPRVRRTAAFEADLQAFYGLKWREQVAKAATPVATYLDRIAMIASDSPHLLVAHAYTQHMAILAGGQFLRRSVRSTMQIAQGEPGTAIFELQEPAKQLKSEYKTVMNSLESKLNEKKTREIIEEHRLVFKLNNSIIATFPVTVRQAAVGTIKLLPPEVLLLIVSLTLALMLAFYTRKWITIDPDAQDFANPDFVSS